MKTVKLGKTGASVSQMCLGTMLMGTKTDRETSITMLDHYMEVGGKFIDTANCYAWWLEEGKGGESESLLGKWMKERHNRDKIFLATKGGAGIRDLKALKDDEGNIRFDLVAEQYEYLSAPVLRRALEGSLRRLQMETIDLYYVHVDDWVTPIEETLETLNGFVKEGKVRHIGCSNFRTWRLERSLNISKAHGWAPYVAIQNEYSYFRPKPGTDMDIGWHTDVEQLNYLKNNEDVTLIAYSPLLKGIYEDKQKREAYYNWHMYDTEDSQVRLNTLSEIAQELNVSNHQLVLAWLLHHQPRVIPIVGASSLEQLRHNLQAASIELSSEQMETLNNASA